MRVHMTRRSLLSGFAAALGTVAVGAPLARAHVPLRSGPDLTPGSYQPIHLSVPFGPGGLMGDSEDGQAYLEHLVRAAIVPPLSDIVIYAHGWLTDGDDLMVIYDTMTEGYVGYHNDIYCKEVYDLVIGFSFARHSFGCGARHGARAEVKQHIAEM